MFRESREAGRDPSARVSLSSQLPEEALLGNRLDSHDWEKISNVNFEGSRSAQEIQKFWQNWEHPSINKQEWSGQEVSQLKAIAATHGHLEWQKIAEELGVRTGASETRGQRWCYRWEASPVWGLQGLRHTTAPAVSAFACLHLVAFRGVALREHGPSTPPWAESTGASSS